MLILTHYLMRDPERYTKFNEYLKAWAGGEESWTAFSRIFMVSASELERKLQDYADHGMTISVFSTRPPDAAVSVESMPAAADTLLLPGLRVALGIKSKGDSNFLTTIRARAADHADEPFAQKVLANAEIIYGDPENANKILRSSPELESDDEALYLDGFASLTRAERAPQERDSLLNEAKVSFGKEFKINPNHYQTLYRYAQASLMQEPSPSDNTINVLIRAHDLAPQVAEIGINTASALMRVKNSMKPSQF